MSDHGPRSLVAAIDQGTTSSRAILFDRGGRIVASHQLEHRQITPRPGWVEHDPDEIVERVRTCVRVALRDAGTDARALAAVGISDQRETTVVWDRRTGRPVHRAIVWQDTRTADAVARLSAGDGGQDRFRARTGLPISTYSSALKLRWILDALAAADGPATGAPRVRDHRRLAHLEPDRRHRRRGPRDRRHERVPDDAHGPRHVPVGSGDPRRAGHPRERAPRDPRLVRGLRRGRRRPGRRADRRGPRRPARGAVRADLLRRRAGEVHVRHGRVHAHATPARRRSRRRTG